MLTPTGWRRDAHVVIGNEGSIEAVEDGAPNGAMSVDVLVPAPANVHSHSFQRAMAGLTEVRAPSAADDFWSWRGLMYKFLERLTPDDIEVIAAQAQVEMLEAGYAAVGEFHYIHHQPDGKPFDEIAELSIRLIAAATETGIGYTHLPVLYMRGGIDDRQLVGGQQRFGCDVAQFGRLFASTSDKLKAAPADFRLGVAPHSLRAVTRDGLSFAASVTADAPIHIHIAEQTAEVEMVKEVLGARPVDWLMDNALVDERWCLIHATHMTCTETDKVARSRAVVGACPVTEANLGDGIFSAGALAAKGGRIGVGTDSNIRISLTEELRLLEYSQRLRDRRRAVLADKRSCGRFLFDHATNAGAQALGRNAGGIEPGALADLVALDCNGPIMAGLDEDQLLDAWIFVAGDRAVSDVWAAGRHVVSNGQHRQRTEIEQRFGAVMRRLRTDL